MILVTPKQEVEQKKRVVLRREIFLLLKLKYSEKMVFEQTKLSH